MFEARSESTCGQKLIGSIGRRSRLPTSRVTTRCGPRRRVLAEGWVSTWTREKFAFISRIRSSNHTLGRPRPAASERPAQQPRRQQRSRAMLRAGSRSTMRHSAVPASRSGPRDRGSPAWAATDGVGNPAHSSRSDRRHCRSDQWRNNGLPQPAAGLQNAGSNT